MDTLSTPCSGCTLAERRPVHACKSGCTRPAVKLGWPAQAGELMHRPLSLLLDQAQLLDRLVGTLGPLSTIPEAAEQVRLPTASDAPLSGLRV